MDYRADLPATPGAATPQLARKAERSELVSARAGARSLARELRCGKLKGERTSAKAGPGREN